jgi:VWFA-related protein
MRVPAVVVGLTALLSLAAPPMGARQAQVQTPTFRTGVDLVQVDVSVLDKQRKPVKGLTAADFTLLEDGKPVAIEAFVPVELPERPPAAAGVAAWVRDVAPDVVANDLPREGRFIAVLFDLTLRPEQLPLARRVATAAIDSMGPTDLAAIVHVGGDEMQGFTRDRARLLSAIESASGGPSGADAALADAGGQATQEARSASAHSTTGGRGQCPYGYCTLYAITRIAEALRDAPRRKTLLFLGTSITLQVVGGLAELEEAREKMLRAVDVANLTVSVMDPTGLETLAADASRPSLVRPSRDRTVIVSNNLYRQENLRFLPERTGGRTVTNANDPDLVVRDVLEETSAYYTLGFRPSATGPEGKLHTIAVRVKRDDVRVNARKAFYAGGGPLPAVSADAKMKNVPPALVAAIGGNWPTTDLPVLVSAAPFADPAASRPVVALAVASERTAARDSQAPIDVLVQAFDQNGRSVNYHHQAFDLGDALAASGRDQYEVLSRLPLEPGRYELRVGIHDAATKRVGTVHTHIDVPDFSGMPLTMSGLVLEATPSPLSAPAGLLTSLFEESATARRTFDRSHSLRMLARIYQGGDHDQPVAIVAQVQDRSGTIVFEDKNAGSHEAAAGSRGTDVRIQLPLDRLVPGEHLLTITAVRGKQTAHRTARFTVR